MTYFAPYYYCNNNKQKQCTNEDSQQATARMVQFIATQSVSAHT